LGSFLVTVTPEFFTENIFGMGNVNTKTFILLLAAARPLSFISGTAVDLAQKLKASNRAEFHHLMPRAFLQDSNQKSKYSDSVLANFCFMSRSDNRELGGAAPSAYRSKMASNTSEVLSHALCPTSLFGDAYDGFVKERAELLANAALQLCG
jgi:hypothetical protein